MSHNNEDQGELRNAMNESRKSLDRLRSEVERLAELLELQSLKEHSHSGSQTMASRKENSRQN